MRLPLGCNEELPPLPSDFCVVTTLPSFCCLPFRTKALCLGDANALAWHIPCVSAIFLWSFFRTSQFRYFCLGISYRTLRWPSLTPKASLRRVSIHLKRRQNTNKSCSVMSRMVSQVSKPCSKKLWRYWVRLKSSKISANSVIATWPTCPEYAQR